MLSSPDPDWEGMMGIRLWIVSLVALGLQFIAIDAEALTPKLADPQPAFAYFGAAMMRCDEWLSSPAKTQEGNSWILGYWSAKNEQTKFVGKQLGDAGIIEETKKLCAPQPWAVLYPLSSWLYKRTEQEGR